MEHAVEILASILSPLKERIDETRDLLLLSRPDVVKVALKEKIKVDATLSRDDVVRQVIAARIKREFAELKPKPKPKAKPKKGKKS